MRCSCLSPPLRRGCTSGVLFAIWLICPGCKGIHTDPTEMVLISNIDGTLFSCREQEVDAGPDEGWVGLGRGREVRVTLDYGKRYELLAQPPGYKTRTVKITEPIKRYSFTFSLGDKKRTVAISRESAWRPYDEVISRQLKTRYARVHYIAVGVSSYQDPTFGLHDLPTAESDAQALAILFDSFGWSRVQVLLGPQATKTALQEAVLKIAETASKDDAVILYFGGHGVPYETRDGVRPVLMLYDADAQKPRATGYALDTLITGLNQSSAKHILLLLDHCASGLIARGEAPEPTIVPNFDALLELPAFLVLTAATGREAALEPNEGDHSFFVREILRVLEGAVEENWCESRVFSCAELFSYVRRAVSAATKGAQTPNLFPGPGPKGGDFVFDLRQSGGE